MWFAISINIDLTSNQWVFCSIRDRFSLVSVNCVFLSWGGHCLLSLPAESGTAQGSFSSGSDVYCLEDETGICSRWNMSDPSSVLNLNITMIPGSIYFSCLSVLQNIKFIFFNEAENCSQSFFLRMNKMLLLISLIEFKILKSIKKMLK